ncbi:hypothetical protein DFJ58DRAFT_837505 [Suillus subalutaceus]|uniref:uncharacterized protein n=1 Tax=Suillus subalutaceus TaxID=48586 RepID=UPI001B87B51E|nr:uncharacterized protein DFJ58DRAFT_837505 [Suillus subalutaceus]KAG1870112.1 hypothetical protein DFJ58DRAFT_837505 [Suillus subalutaceus]
MTLNLKCKPRDKPAAYTRPRLLSVLSFPVISARDEIVIICNLGPTQITQIPKILPSGRINDEYKNVTPDRGDAQAVQTKAEKDAIREANIKAAIQAVREKRAKNLSAAAGQFNVPYHTLRRRPQIPKRDRRAEQERSQAAFTGTIKTKKLEELRDLAAALRLPETGLKAEVFQRILQHFDGNPDLKKNPRYEGLFNPTRSRRRRLDNGDNTAELPQDAIPPSNPVREPFGYQPQPAPQPSMSRNEFPPPGYAPLHYPMQHPAPQPQYISHPHFAPASRSSADFRVGDMVQTQHRLEVDPEFYRRRYEYMMGQIFKENVMWLRSYKRFTESFAYNRE